MTEFVVDDTLAALEDVNLTSPQNNDVLTFNTGAGKWENASAGGGGGTVTRAHTTYTGNNGSFSGHLIDISAILGPLKIPILMTIESGSGGSFDPTESITVAIYGSGCTSGCEDVFVISGNVNGAGGATITPNFPLESGNLFSDATHIDVSYLGGTFTRGGVINFNRTGVTYTIFITSQ